jgi:hypothetical protein
VESLESSDAVVRCCILEFRSRGWGRWFRKKPKALLLAIERPDGSAQFLIERDFRRRVKNEDFDFLQDSVRDYPARAKADCRALFRELASLQHGPIETREVFSCLAGDPVFVELQSKFLPIIWE